MSDKTQTATTAVATRPVDVDTFFGPSAIAKPAAPPKDAKVFTAVPYIGSRTTAGDSKNPERAAELEQAGIPTPSLYLFDAEPLKLDPFAFHILATARYYTRQDAKGKCIGATLELTDKHKELRYQFHVYGVAAVVRQTPAGPKFTAATFNFRGPSSRMFYKIDKMLALAADTADYGSRSKDHEAAVKVPFVGGRVRFSAWSEEQDSDNGVMVVTGCHSQPTPAADVPKLIEWFTKSGRADLSAAAQQHNKNLDERVKPFLGK